MSILWIASAASGLAAGACLVGALVTRPPANLLALVCAGAAIGASATASTGLAAEYGTPLAGAAGLVFACAAFAGGYRAAASLLLDALRPSLVRPSAPAASERSIAVILSDAEPFRYSPQHTAARLERLERSASVRLTPGLLPMVFLAERMRYRAVRGPHPARYVVEAVAEAVRQRLARSASPTSVDVAYVDGSPRLADLLARSGPTLAVVLELGPAGSLPFVEVCAEAERAAASPIGLHLVRPSIWRDQRLAQRLADRICERVPHDERHATGVVLLGAGIPDEWRSASAAWEEDENYFLTRAVLLLQEAGFSQNMVRPAWVEWQAPSLSEAVRHLAAIGSARIVVAPATIVQPDLSTLIDLEREMRDARIPDHIRTTLLPPWGDDDVLVDVVASRFEDALQQVASGS